MRKEIEVGKGKESEKRESEGKDTARRSDNTRDTGGTYINEKESKRKAHRYWSFL